MKPVEPTKMEVQIVDPEELSNAGDLTADLAETDTVDLID